MATVVHRHSGAMRSAGGAVNGPYRSGVLLRAALEHRGRDWVGSGPSALAILPEFAALYRLFALAALEDGQACSDGYGLSRACSGHSHIELGLSERDEPPIRVARPLIAKVCWQSGDGFDIDGERPRTTAHPGALSAHRGLRLEPGTALFIYGGAAVGVGGFVDGRPVAVFTPGAGAIISFVAGEGPGRSYESPLSAAIFRTWVERAR